ncbi:8-oxoguanine glycosylase OGG1 [Sugiyamaella lignohabitans]|uniref:N-glycosylase/DNA lyase n=1 Tax=Sugiyamaella lignohabitans TaxID=796027 RepID=A0A167CV09_9ASCO|nr:8-oxoguanine glycosylase OGG1 [Sugiyamaella lignohabitans]ANB12139.1 8-oxoguanine glycosylase OGG1 [Sugiyamaella lignohabitans]
MAYKGRVIFLRQEQDKLYYSSLFPKGKTEPELDSSTGKSSTTKSTTTAASTATDTSPELFSSATSTLALINDYFNLDVKLSSLYSDWAKCDSHFSKKSGEFPGIRILRQDPWENVCSFICSTNNNIKRISQMVDNLCIHFGDYIATHEGVAYYDFPKPHQLNDPSVEAKLRSLGFGYRAKYIYKTAVMVSTPTDSSSDGLPALFNLRNLSYEEAHEELLKFSGVGPKVADCVCLMSLDKHDCVPVDTHVWQIAQRDYKYGRKYKTLNKVAYDDIRIFFRDLWGPYAGWAHSVLFTADLRDLNNGVNTTTTPTPPPAEGKPVKQEHKILTDDQPHPKRLKTTSPNILKRGRPAVVKVEAN